jgi:hypothetical protein
VPAGNAAADNLRKTLRETIQGMTGALNSLGKPGQQWGLPKATVTKPDTKDVQGDLPSSDNTATLSVPASTSDEVAPESKSSGLSPKASSTDSNAGELKTNANPPVQNRLTAADDHAAAVKKVVDPVTNAVLTVVAVAQSVPGVLVALPNSADPVGDVIASLQVMLTTVSDAVVPLATELPGNLLTLLATPTDTPTPPAVIGRSHALAAFTSEAAPALAPASLLQAGAVPNSSFGPMLGAGVAPVVFRDVEPTAFHQDFSLSGTTALSPQSADRSNVASFLEHTVGAIFLPASLSALAAFALPGIAGLLIVCAAGMRVGYRQAKAAMVARNSRIARFAIGGPLGVVRTGSMIALRRPRGLRSATTSQAALDVA